MITGNYSSVRINNDLTLNACHLHSDLSGHYVCCIMLDSEIQPEYTVCVYLNEYAPA